MKLSDTLLRYFLFTSQRPVVVLSNSPEFVASMRRDLGSQVVPGSVAAPGKQPILCFDTAPFDVPVRELLRLLRGGSASVVYPAIDGWVEISRAGIGFVVASLLSKLFSMSERTAQRLVLVARKALLKSCSVNVIEAAQGTARCESGCCFTAQIPQFRDYSETSGTAAGGFSLFEESTPLRGHQPHSLIRSEGAGRFSLWNETLYFSSTDGTDPLSNGRRYRAFVVPRRSRLLSAMFAFVLRDRPVFEMLVADSLMSRLCQRQKIAPRVSGVSLSEQLAPFLESIDEEKLSSESVLHVCEQSPDRESAAEVQIAIRSAARCGITSRAYDVFSPVSGGVTTSTDGALLVQPVTEVSAGFSFAMLVSDRERAAVRLVQELPEEIRSQVWIAFTHLVAHCPHTLHCWSDESGATWGLAGVLVGVPQIFLTAHESVSTVLPEVHRPYLEQCLRALRLSNRVQWIAQSHAALRAYSLAFDIPAERIRLIRPLVDIDRFCPISELERAGARQTLGIADDSIAIGFTSPLSVVHRPQRFARLLFEARKSNPAIVGVVLGTGPLESYLRAELEALGLSPFCFFSSDTLRYETALGALDIAVFCGVDGSRVRPMLEALAAGIPVVASRFSGTEEVCSARDSGVMSVTSDFTELARTTGLLANDAQTRGALSACARQMVLDWFDAKLQAPNLLDLYTESRPHTETNVTSVRRVANR